MVDPQDIHAECLVVDDFDKIEACIFFLIFFESVVQLDNQIVVGCRSRGVVRLGGF